jgi:hypothetical protein
MFSQQKIAGNSARVPFNPERDQSHQPKFTYILQAIDCLPIRMSQPSQISCWATINMQTALNEEIQGLSG